MIDLKEILRQFIPYITEITHIERGDMYLNCNILLEIPLDISISIEDVEYYWDDGSDPVDMIESTTIQSEYAGKEFRYINLKYSYSCGNS